MPTLPTHPSLENLKKQAKRLLKAAKAQDPETLSLVGPYFGDPSLISLQQAQLVVARNYGFSSWTRLKRHVEAGAGGVETTEQRANRFLDLVCIHYGPDPNRGVAEFEEAAALLAAHPEIAHTACMRLPLRVIPTRCGIFWRRPPPRWMKRAALSNGPR